MVAINKNAKESTSVKLAKPIDAVGRLEITTSSNLYLEKFNTGTATLVAPNKILTAAHVIDPDLNGVINVKDFSKYSFELGDDLDVGADNHSLKIDQVSLHPSWQAAKANRVSSVDGGENAVNPRYDLAVLTLSENFTDVAPVAVSPNVPELADSSSLLRKKGTLIGYGDYGNPAASLDNVDGLRRAAENIIDSVDNGLIRFDYDSTYSVDQNNDNYGFGSPNLDGSAPELEPVTGSSPKPIPLEGGIGSGDSGGPLLVDSDLGPTVVGVASEFIDPDVVFANFPVSSYGSIYVYSSFDDPKTRDFLRTEDVIGRDTKKVAASSVLGNSTEILDTSLTDTFATQNDDFIYQSNDFI